MTAGRERPDTKGKRLLGQGRVQLAHVSKDEVDAEVTGDGANYRVTFGRGGWYCTCPCRVLCSHLIAVRLVTAPIPTRGGGRA